jgi:hypothetical protein
MILRPKTIEPGWARRWTRQSLDLFRRAPGLAVSVTALFALVNAFVPQPLQSSIPATVFLVGLLFCSLRAADHDSAHAWASTWSYFRQTAGDLARLARDAFVWMLVFGLALGLFFALFHLATHGLSAHPSPAVLHRYRQLPFWLRQGVRQGNGMDMLGIFMPGAIPLVFLTLYAGNQFWLHFHTGYRASLLNLRMTYFVTIAGMAFCMLTAPLLQEAASATLGFLLLAVYAVAFWWFGAWGYLWCREMFEGEAENARQTQKCTASLPVHSGA